MGIEITSLSDLAEDDVTQAQEELAQMTQEQAPTLSTKTGVLRAVLINPASILHTKNREEISRLQQASSLRAIEADPTVADEETVDNVLSNYRITRKDGAQAQGQLTIVLSSNLTTAIGNGSVFEADGQQFTANAAYVGKSNEASVQTSTDRLIQALSDGTFAFVIDVTAVSEGSEGNLRKDAPVVMLTPPLNYVKAYATSDFTSGRAIETNSQLIARLQEGLSDKSASNRVSMNAMLRASEDFENVLATSIIGFGDPEMLRDRHAIWPGSLGGRVDWYVRSQGLPQHLSQTVTATLIEINSASSSVWQFSLDRDQSAGVYEVRSVLPADAGEGDGTYEITEDIRSLDLTGDRFIPDLVDVEEGVYSRFQTITIRFTDTETDVSDMAVGDTQDYIVETVGMPLIAEIHDYVSERTRRHAAADILVKAPMPCFLQVSFTIQQQAGEDDEISTDGIRAALADVINGISFTGRLPASILTDTIHNFLPDSASLSAIDMLGRIRTPDGETIWLRDDEVLTAPDRPDQMTTYQTLQFFAEPEDIAISLATVGSLPI